MRYVYDMYQYIGFAHLVKGAFKGLYKLRREFSDKSYGIAQKERYIAYYDLSDGGVEGGEKLVLGKYVRLRKEVHQSGLAYIGISDEREPYELAAVASLGGHLPVYLRKLFLEPGYPFPYYAPVYLNLAFTHSSAHSYTAPLPFEVGPHSGEPGEHVVVSRELHLHLRVRGLRPLREYLEYEARTVYHR